MTHAAPRSTLFPYTTLFRSDVLDGRGRLGALVRAAVQDRDVVATIDEAAHEGDAGRSCPADDEDAAPAVAQLRRSEEHTSELQSHVNLVCRLLLENKKRATQ